SAYEHPQPHACFIQSVGDDLVNEGGIMDLWVREARLFKYGSGTGSNFSYLRGEGEKLSGRSEEHTSELQSRENLVCRLLLEKKNNYQIKRIQFTLYEEISISSIF